MQSWALYRTTKGCVLLVTVGLLLTWYPPSAASARSFRKGPYLQNVSRTSITVMWESDRTRSGVVRLLGPDARSFQSPDDDMHEVQIDGLFPGHRYRYRVECGDESSEGEFATAPDAGAPFSFVVYGDSRSGTSRHRRIAERIRGEVADFLLGTGDMVDEGGRDADWQNFFDIERDLLRENVLFPSLGNHDRQSRGKTADNFRTYFSLPENSPDPERYYAFSYSSARFLVLDSNAHSFSLTDQTAWIEQQLQSARLDPGIKHIFVSMHHPPFSVALHGGQSELREAWAPLFERYRVAAVFSGHDHVYSRAQRNGVHYIVSGGAGAPLYARGRRPSALDLEATRFFERTSHYVKVHVVGDYVEMTGLRSDGSHIETVRWGAPPMLSVATRLVGSPPEGVGSAVAQALGQRQGMAPPSELPAADLPAMPSNGLGLLSKLGILVVLFAGVVLLITLSRP